jgi:hypothetical protein
MLLYLKYAAEGLPYGTPVYIVLMMLRAFNSWMLVIGFLGLGRKYLSFTNHTLKYFSEASLPIYMLHQTVIVIIGFFIKDWAMSILPKFILLGTASFIGIMTVYELFIRRNNVIRLLFGLKKKNQISN